MHVPSGARNNMMADNRRGPAPHEGSGFKDQKSGYHQLNSRSRSALQQALKMWRKTCLSGGPIGGLPKTSILCWIHNSQSQLATEVAQEGDNGRCSKNRGPR